VDAEGSAVARTGFARTAVPAAIGGAAAAFAVTVRRIISGALVTVARVVSEGDASGKRSEMDGGRCKGETRQCDCGDSQESFAQGCGHCNSPLLMGVAKLGPHPTSLIGVETSRQTGQYVSPNSRSGACGETRISRRTCGRDSVRALRPRRRALGSCRVMVGFPWFEGIAFGVVWRKNWCSGTNVRDSRPLSCRQARYAKPRIDQIHDHATQNCDPSSRAGTGRDRRLNLGVDLREGDSMLDAMTDGPGKPGTA